MTRPADQRARLLLGLCAGLLMLGVVACDAVVDRMVRRQATAPPSVDASDGALHVVLCGTGSPLPDPERAASCTAVLAGGQFLVFDAGPGAWENMQVWGMPVGDVSAVLITHFHSDHIGGLGETLTQAWIASGRGEPLPVHGPPGIEDVVEGFNRAYSHDRVYREVHHTREYLPEAGGRGVARSFTMPAPGERVTVLETNGVKVVAFAVDHTPVEPAVGYRVEFGGRSVVISGDTAPTPSLVASAAGADVLVHEALSFELIERISRIVGEAGRDRQSKLALDVLDYHTSPVQAKQMADEAGVGLLVLSHNVPPLRNAVVERMFTAGLDMNGVVVGDDGMHFTLPQGSEAIEQGSL